MYLMSALLWYLFVATIEAIVTFKKSIVKYICYKVDKMISPYRVHLMFQYFTIYFNKIISDKI